MAGRNEGDRPRLPIGVSAAVRSVLEPIEQRFGLAGSDEREKWRTAIAAARLNPTLRAAVETTLGITARTREATHPLDTVLQRCRKEMAAFDQAAGLTPRNSRPEVIAEMRRLEQRQLAEDIAEAVTRRRRPEAATVARPSDPLAALAKRKPDVLDGLTPRQRKLLPDMHRSDRELVARHAFPTPAAARAAVKRLRQRLERDNIRVPRRRRG